MTHRKHSFPLAFGAATVAVVSVAVRKSPQVAKLRSPILAS